MNRLDLLIGRNSDEAGFFPAAFWTRLPKLFDADWPAARALVDPAAALSDNTAARQLAGDIFAGVNTAAIARAAAHGGRVYAYHFDVVPEAQRNTVPGAVHTAELPYVFENLPAGSDSAATKISAQMASLWVHFAKTGRPAASEVWPQFQADEQLLLIRNEGFSIGKDPAKTRLDWLDQPRRWHVN